ncbi:MAG: serine/threonine-protein kinase [Anaerolineales bacterium]|nr:MAG: serine/threonine-protein kinase [Anaerolineales bacterium]
MPLSQGENVGPYRIIEQLGQGGMATVFKAYHPALDRYVAIKVLHPAFKEDPNFLARFQREARIVAKLEHPHIVPVYDFSEHKGMAYLVMRYVEGETLKAHLTGEPLPPERILEILKPVAEALAYAHEQGVLHRDIKPSNVMLTPEDSIFLTDFGLARMAQSGESTLSKDMMIGTPQYMSPEQAKGEKVDERTDIYSLGVVLFEMLTGRVPFSADTPYAVVHDHIYTPLPLPTTIKSDISPALERVLLKALAKEKDDRYQKVTELALAFEDAVVEATSGITPALEEEAAELTTVPSIVVEAKPAVPETKPSRKRWLVIGGAVAALLILVCCAGFFLASRAQKAKGTPAPRGPTPIARPEIKPTPLPGGPTELPPPDGKDPVSQALRQVQANPEDPHAHLMLANAYALQGNKVKALEEYERTIELDPEYAEAYMKAGDMLAAQRDLTRAAEMYQRAVELQPDNIEANLKAGQALWGDRQIKPAVEYFERVAELDPDLPLPHAALGNFLIGTGQLEEGREELETAIRLDPRLPEAHFGMGLYWKAVGDIEEARREFEFVARSDAKPWLVAEARRELQELE